MSNTYITRNISKINNFLSSNLKEIPLLDRWLILELIPPLIFAIAALSTVSLSLGVMLDLVRKIVESGLPFQSAFKVLILRLPGFLVISFPMAMLMSSLLAYSKLSSNSEIKALRSLGVLSRRMVASALVLGFFMTSLTFFFNDFVVPKSNRLAEATLRKGLKVAMHSDYGTDIMYSRFGKIINPLDRSTRDGLTHLFYAVEFQNKVMKDVTVLDFTRLGYTQMLVAKRAIWKDADAQWLFENGKILTLAPNNTSTSVDFDSYIYPLDSGPRQIAELPKDANNMTIYQARKAEQLYKQTGNIKEERRMKVRIQEKFTLPIACIVFALIGSSLGLKSNIRKSQSQGFGLSIVLILVYYVLSFSFSSLGITGSLDPLLAAWSPVLISLSGGGFLLSQADK
ncbi:LptF/LptG family permease [Prochlorococcus sp. MIT 1223]|uniref:LptF/LptG family permease n=1 Tax=Prochlorococcus sp. MIT 1223 TaxID=3096217 RepID=UPI002A749CF5|nr:LptF/LptG family permease [Prochlorococcus sp. MIT 1223]